jgi:hypothetical protein
MQITNQVNTVEWSDTDKTLALTAFKTAYLREIEALKQTVRERASRISELEDLWQLHDFLSARRFDIDGKYDPSETGLVFVLARLVKERWLCLEELAALDPEKRAKIGALSRM